MYTPSARRVPCTRPSRGVYRNGERSFGETVNRSIFFLLWRTLIRVRLKKSVILNLIHLIPVTAPPAGQAVFNISDTAGAAVTAPPAEQAACCPKQAEDGSSADTGILTTGILALDDRVLFKDGEQKWKKTGRELPSRTTAWKNR